MADRSLTAAFGANTTGFTAGVEKVKRELTELNAKLSQNKQEVKEVNKEISELGRRQSSLAAKMKNGSGSKAQIEAMSALKEKISAANEKLGQLKANESEIKAKIAAANGELKNQITNMNDNTKSAGLLHKALDKLGTAAKAFIGIYGAKKLWELLIGSNEEMEQYQTSFEVMLGDAEKAKTLITDIQNFAAKTPLSKSDSVSIGSLLMNYGVEADEVIDKMTKLGDLAGGNADKMNRIALAYGQMLAKGKVTGEELRQLTEAGVPMQNALAESIGVTGEEFSKMVSAGKVGIEDLDKAIEELTTGNGKFAGMMEKQSQTMQGMLSTLKDNVSEFFRQMGGGAFGEVKDVLSDLMAQLNEWEKDGTLQEWAEKLGVTLKMLIQLLRGAIEIFAEFGDVIIAVFAGTKIYRAMDDISDKFNNLKEKIEKLGVDGVAGKARAGFKEILSSINPTAIALSVFAVAVTGVILKINELNQAAENYNKSVESIESSANSNISSTRAEISMLENKIERYDELRTAADLTSAQEAELRDIASELQDVFGDEITVVDKVKGSYNDLSEALENYTQKRLTSAKTAAAYNQLEEYYKLQYENNQKIATLTKDWTYSDYSNAAAYTETGFWSSVSAGVSDSFKIFGGPFDKGLLATEGGVSGAGDWYQYRELREIQDDLENKIKSLEAECGNLDRAMYESAEATADTADENKNLADSYKKTKAAIEANKEAADKLASSIKNVNSAYLEQKENGKLSYDTIMSLVDAGYATCLQIDEETNSVKFNTEAYKDLAQAKIEARMTDLRTDMAEKTAEIEVEYKEKLSTYSDFSHSGTGSLYAEHIAEYINNINQQKDKAIAAATAEAAAELAALQDLYDNIGSYVTAEKTTTASSKKTEVDEVKEAVDNLTKSLKSVNSAYLEQQENGKLSYDTAMSLIDAGYASCLEIDEETNAIRLNTEAYEELARAKLNARMNDLKAGDITSEVTAELAALQDLYDNIDSYVKADNSKTKSETIDYSKGYEAYKTEADKKIALINKELEAKKELRDKTIAYLDEEIKKRKELNEDDDMQREIDRVAAQLEYAQLDDFSRAQLEKKLKSLKEEQGEILWERDIQRQKDEANQAYESAAASASEIQEQINNSVAVVKQIIDALKDGVTNINNVINNNNTVNNSANISLANQYLTMAQITKAVRDALIGDVTILTR